MTKLTATLAVLLLLAGALSACNTIAGAGEDLSAAGKAVTRSAEKVGGSK
jgi:predicted small secreted protein